MRKLNNRELTVVRSRSQHSEHARVKGYIKNIKPWWDEQATDKQVDALRNFGFEDLDLEYISRYKASVMLNESIKHLTSY